MSGVKVDGLRALIRDLEKAGVKVADLREAFGLIARRGKGLAIGFAPRRSGTLASSIRSNTAKNYAAVTAGGARAPYAGPINYGWLDRDIKPSGFMQKADAAIRPHVARELETAITRMLRERNLK